jgi:LysM repeat protein
MNRLQEKRALLALAQRFGQPPAPGLVEEIQRLEEEQRCARLREDEIRSRLAADLQQIWGEHHELVQPPPESHLTEDAGTEQTAQADLATHEAVPPTRTPVTESIADKVARVITEAGVVAPDPVLAQPQKDLAQEIKYLREWVSRIAATGPGGGEVNLRYLDDINRSTIQDGYFLRYDASTKKFVFDQVASGTVIYGTTSTTTSYTVQTGDYYIGVSSNAQVTINIPISAASGRSIIIKDESGRCSVNNITIAGTIDNDTSGAILAIDNGALHLIYRQGWRII